MTRSELIETLQYKNPALSIKDCEAIVQTILNAISQIVSKGGRCEIRGFGSFKLNHRPERKARNPKSGASVMVPAKYSPHFKAGVELRERVDFKKPNE